jgi:hypothetical protein
VRENEHTIWVWIRRAFGQTKEVSVDFDMISMTDENVLFSERIEYRHGTVVFKENEVLIPLAIKVFKRLYHETTQPSYKLNLFMPRNGAQIGPQNTQLIYYYDDESLNDVNNTYCTLNT